MKESTSKISLHILMLICLSVTLLGTLTIPVEAQAASATYVSVSAGHIHACAITSRGGVQCWGDNSAGQLGNGTKGSANKPIDVTGLNRGIIAISAGYFHTCALNDNGKVECWGGNEYGELGNGSTVPFSTTPVQVSGLSDVDAISAGRQFTCALANGGVKCWGKNYFGQLGNNSTTNSNIPVDVVGLSSNVIAISAGQDYACAVMSSGGVKCWGSNEFWQIGNSTVKNVTVIPVDVEGLTNATAIASGYYNTCAIVSGNIKCWGGNRAGQLGDGTTTDSITPVDVVGLTETVSTVSIGSYNTCAVTISGSVKCWGGNDFGQIGDGTYALRRTPVDAIGLTSGVLSLATGENFACAVTGSGNIKCWGQGGVGQLADGITGIRFVPNEVVGLNNNISAISAGSEHVCAVLNDGSAKCWGSNTSGVLGIGGSGPYWNLPLDVIGLNGKVQTLTAGQFHTCALISGNVQCWGRNVEGQLGNNQWFASNVPIDVVGLPPAIKAITAGAFHTCALTQEGGVKCWGFNINGQLGNGTKTNSNVPVNVQGLESGVIAISAGGTHTCALTMEGTVKCWGANRYGQLGDGTNIENTTPVTVANLNGNVNLLVAGSAHTCVLTSDKGVMCWGSNLYGELGDGTTTQSSLPVKVIGLPSLINSLSLGWYYSCAITGAGGLKCWGLNTVGQLGNRVSTDSSIPVDAIGLTSGVSAVATGFAHICALLSDGSVQCWGSNSLGQLGDGRDTWINIPADIINVPNSPIFGDVPGSYWANSWIERLYDAGVSGGCGAGNYCPEQGTTRAQMAVFLLRAKYGSTYTPSAATGNVFQDVDANYWAAAWIEQLAAEGVTGGCGDGNYCPEVPVTRDQMAVFLLRAMHDATYAPPAAGGSLFGDVSADYWAAPWIEELAAKGITRGCGGGNYCPETVVTRAQMAVFLVNAFGLP